MLERLKKEVLYANLELPQKGLVTYTWGNVSGIDRDQGLVVIKPSGIEYEKLTAQDLVVVDLEGNKVEGDLNPSSDTSTHLVLYRKFKDIGGIVHTHSCYATSWSQAGRGLDALGTTHADYFYGRIPCTRKMTSTEIEGDYEVNTGKVILEAFRGKNALDIPGVLVNNHGPFTWGKDPAQAVYHAVVLEEVCKMNLNTYILNPNSKMGTCLLNRHFLRKHGKGAYYGQNK